MDAQITIGQLITVLFAIAGGGVLFFLFKALVNLNQILNNINKMMQRNENNIDDVLNTLPNILNNTEEITKSVNEEMKHVSGAIKAVEETMEYTASAAQVISDDIILPAKDLLEILAIVKSIFTKDKKKSWFDK
jgi:predicted PurR-regulated permease PerM